MIFRNETGQIEVDATRDSSLWGLFAFGLYSPDDPKIVSSMADLKEALWLKTDVGGMARYEGDEYHRTSRDVPGNPWFLCTLWMADYFSERAADEECAQQAIKLLNWVAEHALPSGVLAEQVHPFNGQPVSVSPLAWSHGTFVASVHRLLMRLGKSQMCPECGLALTDRSPKEHWIETLFSEACDEIYGLCAVK